MTSDYDDATILGVLRLAVARGVWLDWRGHDTVTPDQALLGIRHPEALDAEVLGVRLETLRAYRGHDWACRGTTAKGKPCRSPVLGRYRCFSDHAPPENFDPESPLYLYCRQHQPAPLPA